MRREPQTPTETITSKRERRGGRGRQETCRSWGCAVVAGRRAVGLRSDDGERPGGECEPGAAGDRRSDADAVVAVECAGAWRGAVALSGGGGDDRGPGG